MSKIDISHQQMIFRDSIGQKATVQRETLGASAAETPNRKLSELGRDLNPLPDTNLRYMGSAAVHIFYHAGMSQVYFVSQSDPLIQNQCPEDLASKGFDDLLRQMKETYGKRHGRLRSGF